MSSRARGDRAKRLAAATRWAADDRRLGSLARFLPSVRRVHRSSAPPRSRVLVAESQPELHDVLGCLLRDASYHPVFTTDAMQLIEAVTRTPPDILVLDADLGWLDGVRALELVRAIRRDLPIVVLSCLPDRALDRAAERSGVVALLRKPFRNADLLDAIAKGLVKGLVALRPSEGATG